MTIKQALILYSKYLLKHFGPQLRIQLKPGQRTWNMGTSCANLYLGGRKTTHLVSLTISQLYIQPLPTFWSSSMFVPLFLNNKITFECGFIFTFRNIFLHRTRISFSSWSVLSFFSFFLIDHGSYSHKNETWFYSDWNIVSSY